MSLDEIQTRVRGQQQHVLRALLKGGKTPETIVKEFPTDWTVEEIRDLQTAEAMKDE